MAETVQERSERMVGAAPGEARRRYRALAVGVAASDGLCLVAALLTSYLVRFGLAPMPPDFAAVVVLAPLMWIGIFHGFKLYAPWRLAPAEEFRRILGASSVGIVVVVLASYWSHSSFSRAWVGLTWGFVLLLELLVRRGWRHYLGRLKTDGRLALRTLIVGTNREAVRLSGTLAAAGTGFAPLGHVLVGDLEGTADEDVHVVGKLSTLADAISGRGADCLFVASSALERDEVAHVARTARQLGAEVWVTANLPMIMATRLTAQPIGPAMVLSLGPVQLTRPQIFAKRIFDLVIAGATIVVTAPVWIVAALLIKGTSRGPILYRQQRIGRREHRFTMLKFRTMVQDADRLRGELATRNEASEPLFKMRRDPRVTRVGRWLRRWSLDELPQLVNVLRGDMSLVGPRPPLPEEVSAYEDWHLDRLEVAPGITGLWQVSGRSDLSFDDAVRLDIFYIENWSLAYDLFILAKTIPVVFRGRGAY